MREPQYMHALERANRVRLARASLKRRIASGEVAVAAVVVECPWEAEGMDIGCLLMSQRRWGRTRCRKLLSRLGVSENRPVGRLTMRQRLMLASMLADGARRGRDTEPVAYGIAPPEPVFA